MQVNKQHTDLGLAHLLALCNRGEPVGSAVAAAVHEGLAAARGRVVVHLGQRGEARARVHRVLAYVCVQGTTLVLYGFADMA